VLGIHRDDRRARRVERVTKKIVRGDKAFCLGAHRCVRACAASVGSRAAGADDRDITTSLARFRRLNHRRRTAVSMPSPASAWAKVRVSSLVGERRPDEAGNGGNCSASTSTFEWAVRARSEMNLHRNAPARAPRRPACSGDRTRAAENRQPSLERAGQKCLHPESPLMDGLHRADQTEYEHQERGKGSRKKR